MLSDKIIIAAAKERDEVTIQERIIESLKGHNQPKSLYVLVGFNYWIKGISNTLKTGTTFLDVPDTNQDMRLDLSELNTAMSSGDAVYISPEVYIWLSDNSLAGIPAMYGYEAFFIINDLFLTYYPDTPSVSEALAKQELFLADTDNHIQKYYSDYQNREGSGFLLYNLEIDLTRSLRLTSLLVKDVNQSIDGDTIDIPEEFDNVAAAQLLLNAVTGKVSNIVIAEEVKDQKRVSDLTSIFSFLGVNISYQSYRTQEIEISPERAEAYRSILRRKNSEYDFFDLKVYEDPYESTSLTNVSQLQIIDDIVANSLLSQKREIYRDVFVTAPTGAGKSVMFQVPAIYLAENHSLLTIIVSPLIGLMNDQVANIVSMTDTAATINSDYTPLEKETTLERVKNGEVSLLYLSPESLLSNTDITSLIGDRKIGLVVIDEAHIVATWGKSFRPDYWYLGDFVKRLRNDKHSQHRFPIITFTATATFGSEDNMYQEIVDSLNMTPNKYIGNVKRDDIHFDIRHKTKDVAYKEEKLSSAVSTIETLRSTGEKTLVYVPYTGHIYNLFQKLTDTDKIGRYHGGMTAADKNETLSDIKSGEKSVVLATKAFGMGIDIDDIKYVYHFAPTGNIADYVQEFGRAARKQGMEGVAVTDFYKEDFRYVNQLYGMSSIKNYQVVGVLQKIFDLYTKYKKRNFLVAPEEFSYIFADSKPDDIDAKLKTTLLIIKKDFEFDTHNTFVPLIFKPRGLFTEGFFTVKDDFMPLLEANRLMKYLEKQDLPRKVKSLDRFGNEIIIQQAGDTYRLNFKRLWEDRYKDMSFGMFKRNFFENELPGFSFKVGESFLSRMIIEVDGGAVLIGDVRGSVLSFLNELQGVLDEMKIANKHYSTAEIANIILEKTSVKKRSVATMLGSTIIMLLKRVETNSLSDTYGFSSYNSITNRYVIRNNGYDRIIRILKNCAKSMLANTNQTKTYQYCQNKTASNEVIIAQLIEILELADVKMSSGQNPEFFIRVNNPGAIERIINSRSYMSRTVRMVGERHKESAKLMEYFFTQLKDDEERWNFIEEYFLGLLDINEIIPKEQISHDNDNEAQ